MNDTLNDFYTKQPIQCASGGLVSNIMAYQPVLNNIYSNFQITLFVDDFTLKADCVGTLVLPHSLKKIQFWMLFAPKNPVVAFYDADLTRW